MQEMKEVMPFLLTVVYFTGLLIAGVAIAEMTGDAKGFLTIGLGMIIYALLAWQHVRK